MAIRFCKGEDKFEYKLQMDSNLFKKAHEIFLNQKVEYISIFDKERFICCCYNDEKCDKIMKHILNMTTSIEACKKISKINKIEIISFNEISFYIYNFFKKAGCKIKCVGEFWDKFSITSDFENETADMTFYCEGNPGLALSDLGYWKNSFPYTEYDFFEKLFKRLYTNKKIYNKQFISKNKTQNIIINLIQKNIPFMAARLGNTESSIVQEYLHSCYSKKWVDWLYNTSGFFSKNEISINDINKYSRLTISAVKNCDINCCRFENEIGILNTFSNENCINTDWYYLYTDIDKNTWLKALENKNVLIISSFNKSIKRQYKIKEQLFSYDILPNMNLVYYDMVETQLGNNLGYENFFKMYYKILHDISKINFDIALISAGAYGFLLASDIKNMGKQSIELCSGLYPIFGIKNNTQSIIRKVSEMYNHNWIFPLDVPNIDIRKIENSAYWE